NQPVSGELVFTHDPILTPVDYDPDPVSVSGNEITFAIPEVQLGGASNFSISYEDVSADLLGEELTASYTITTFDDQGNVANTDASTITDTLLCAYDPNDKFGFPLGEGPEGLIAEGTPLRYRIRFQNTGNLPATTVVVRDTLPDELNWESFVPLTASHSHTIMMDSETREVTWTFDNIMLPDSASDPEGSVGSIWFDIEMNDLDLGDQIENTAYIFFDQNAPIITNTSLHTISEELSVNDSEKAPFIVFPNPAQEVFFIGGEVSGAQTIQITDLSGRVVLQKSLNRNGIDISTLSDGLYLVTIGMGKTVKLMVAKP
ncbi:MAG: T9SS type A sorting domain-containing protein, partial [Flavobacteriales bacterium]|nr:T9SS type A sorting domain-containing protein [Flavobacteriales bacterium]